MPVVEVPGHGDVEFPDSMSDEQIAQAIQKNAAPQSRMENHDEVMARVKAQYAGMGPLDKLKGDLASAKSSITPLVRGGWDAISALPGMAADMGVSARNMLTGSNYTLPSKDSEQSLDTVLPMPDTPGSSTMRFGASLLGGAKLPVPQVNNPAPAGFIKPSYDAVRQATLQRSQEAGYKVPPATTNPSIANKILESIGGKVATAQDAASKNQDVTNMLAKRAIGLNEDAPLTLEALSATRKEAGDAYKVVRSVGATALDDSTTKTLDGIASKFTGSKLKEVLGGKSDVPAIVQALKDEPLTGDTAVDAIDMLRSKADVAYRAGEKELGKAYKGISKSIEDLMEKQLSGDALKNFRESRQLIAKTHTVEGAFNPSTGGVSATKLAGQLGKKPLSGELKTAAQFGQAFPKAAQSITDSGAVRNTDVIVGAATSAASKEPGWMMYPFARQAMRAYLLGPGQGRGVLKASQGLPPEAVLAALIGANQAR